MKKCSHCDRLIHNFETAFLHNGLVICRECHGRLQWVRPDPPRPSVSALSEKAQAQQLQQRELRKSLLEQIGDAPVVPLKHLAFLGERFKSQYVTLPGARFQRPSETLGRFLPGVLVASNGLISQSEGRRQGKWLGFSVADEDGNWFDDCFALKESQGDLVLDLRSGQNIDIVGYVVELNVPERHGLIALAIETEPLPVE